jgi:outer membrane receptor protein involved in Fe transport
MLSLEVNNVFDRTPPAGESETTYELGRQFWLGMTYEF